MSTSLVNPEYPDDPKKQQAYTQYVAKARSLNLVSADTGVPAKTLKQWIADDDWDSQRKQLSLKQREATSQALGNFVAERAMTMLSRYSSLHDALLDQFDLLAAEAAANGEPLSPNQLKTLANSLATTFGMGKDMLNLAGLGLNARDDKELDGPQGAAIQVNILNALQDAATQQREEARLDPVDIIQKES